MAFTAGGNLTNFGNAVSGTGINFTVAGANIPAGSLLILGWVANVAALTVTCTDNSTQAGAANTYTIRSPRAAASLSGGIVWCVLTRQINIGDLISIQTSASASRRAGIGTYYTVGNTNAVIDKTGTKDTNTTSPVTCSSTGALSQTNELVTSFGFWKGGAVATGAAHTSPAGLSTHTEANSGGATTTTAVELADVVNIGATTALTDTWTYTAGFASAAGEVLTWTDNAAGGPTPHQLAMTGVGS